VGDIATNSGRRAVGNISPVFFAGGRLDLFCRFGIVTATCSTPTALLLAGSGCARRFTIPASAYVLENLLL
jgi:hypothetical protein